MLTNFAIENTSMRSIPKIYLKYFSQVDTQNRIFRFDLV